MVYEAKANESRIDAAKAAIILDCDKFMHGNGIYVINITYNLWATAKYKEDKKGDSGRNAADNAPVNTLAEERL